MKREILETVILKRFQPGLVHKNIFRYILQILKNLKVKNCEGFDRIPLRILNEGAELLSKPLSSLF